MDKIQWRTNFNTNISIIDEQHKKLISMINELNDLLYVHMDNERLKIIVIEVVNYTKSHFRTEEKFLEENKYPYLAEHKREHQIMVNKIIGMLNKFRDGDESTSFELLNFLKAWYVKHILRTDLEYAKYFNKL